MSAMVQASTPLSFDLLKTKQRAIRSEFPEALALRVHRALSWLKRAEMAGDDEDAAFIFLWIAFNAAYAREIGEAVVSGERAAFGAFFRRLSDLDTAHRVYDAIWQRFSQSIRMLLDNRYIFDAFWKHQNGVAGNQDWLDRFERSRRDIATKLGRRDTLGVLMTLFDRLYVLRNQLVHGGATWSGRVNRDQVHDGARILGFLVPIFIDLMMDNPEAEWGPPYYPVVD